MFNGHKFCDEFPVINVLCLQPAAPALMSLSVLAESRGHRADLTGTPTCLTKVQRGVGEGLRKGGGGAGSGFVELFIVFN